MINFERKGRFRRNFLTEFCFSFFAVAQLLFETRFGSYIF